MLHRHGLIVTVVAAFSCCVRADTIFVDDDNCPGPGSGMELDPYCSIQTAIDNAVHRDEIIVLPGTLMMSPTADPTSPIATATPHPSLFMTASFPTAGGPLLRPFHHDRQARSTALSQFPQDRPHSLVGWPA